jgi:hypothetical protein
MVLDTLTMSSVIALMTSHNTEGRILSDVNGFIMYEQREQSQSEVKSDGAGRSR